MKGAGSTIRSWVELDIYHIDQTIGKGLPLWLPKGTVIRDELERYAKDLEFAYG